MISMNKESIRLRRMLVSALLLAIALVLKTFFSINIPLLGENGMSVGVAGVFSMLPSILFGPYYGAAVSGLSDLLGYIIKPDGAFMPLLTLTAALGGFLRGFLYIRLKDKKSVRLRVLVSIMTALMLVLGVGSVICMRVDGIDGTFYDRVTPEETAAMTDLTPISSLLIARTASTKNPSGNLASYIVSLTGGPLTCAAFCLLILLADRIIDRYFAANRAKINTLAILLAVSVSGVIVTTLNTVILREMLFASWKVIPFAVLWLPRAIEELLAGVVKVCFMGMLTAVCAKMAKGIIR